MHRRILAFAIIAALSPASCQLFARVTDCDNDSDCAAGSVCNDTRHFCQTDTPELCDGHNVDDDHDGIPDSREDFGPCRLPMPASGSACRDGRYQCTAMGLSCVVPEAQREDCTNGIDDDCNGLTDDGPSCMASYPAIVATQPVNIGSNDPNFGEGDDAPEHPVCSDAFRIDKYEVSVASFMRFLNTQIPERISVDTPTPINPIAPREHYALVDEGGGQLRPYLRLAPEATPALTFRYSRAHGFRAAGSAMAMNAPMVNVTWYGANAYCRWAGKHLPTEAEWWRAARGADGRGSYPWGNSAADCDHANIGTGGRADGGRCVGMPVAVDSLTPSGNPEGVLHLYGNAQEWMFDWLDETVDRMRNNYYQDPPDGGWCGAYPAGPLGPDAGGPVSAGPDAGLACLNCRFARGRSYGSSDSRIGVRARLDADRGDDFTGFRCATGGAPR